MNGTNPLEQFTQTLAQFVPDTAKRGQTLFLGAFDRRGIFEAPVNLLRAAGKNRAIGFGVITNGDHAIEVLAGKFVNGFRAMARYVDAQLLHHGDRLRAHLRGLGPCAEYLETITGIVPQQAFGHLAAG